MKDKTINQKSSGSGKKRLLGIVGLQLSVLLYSITGIFTKMASACRFLSVQFLLLYGVSIFLMFIYALLWQQFLKIMPLNTAYANKSISTIWTMLFGALLFHEKITWTMILGAAVIIVGVYLVVTADE